MSSFTWPRSLVQLSSPSEFHLETVRTQLRLADLGCATILGIIITAGRWS
jgi:hypothetical protein